MLGNSTPVKHTYLFITSQYKSPLIFFFLISQNESPLHGLLFGTVALSAGMAVLFQVRVALCTRSLRLAVSLEPSV